MEETNLTSHSNPFPDGNTKVSVPLAHTGNKINGLMSSSKTGNETNFKVANQRTNSSVSFHESSKTMGRYLNHRKLCKKGKREPKPHLNGDAAQSLQSLKVTIRRTYKSNKTDTEMCTIVNSVQDYLPDVAVRENNCDEKPLKDDAIKSQTYVDVCGTEDCKTGSVPVLNNNNNNTNNYTTVDATTSTMDSTTITEPHLLGPCEPGTKIIVDGVVWLETSDMLVLSVQWRGRNYIGTLLDTPKQTFAPPCTDKGIVSALSLLKGRKPWPHGSPGGYRTRGLRHYHHCRNCHRRGGGFGLSGSITTRSASAAAAATTSRSDLPMSVNCDTRSNTHGSNDDDDDRYTETHSNESEHVINHQVTDSNSSTSSNRGGKGRRRRGIGRKIQNSDCGSPTDLSKNEPYVSDDTKTDDQLSPSGAKSNLPLACPFQNCEKRFPDLLSMRYHFTLGHSAQTTGDAPNPIKLSQDSTHTCTIVDLNALSPPPKLARVHTRDTDCETNKTVVDVIDVSDKDNVTPPKLQRVMSITDSNSDNMQLSDGNSPSEINAIQSPGTLDEPPAPSPAYSDISDDGIDQLTVSIPVLEVSQAQLLNQSFPVTPLLPSTGLSLPVILPSSSSSIDADKSGIFSGGILPMNTMDRCLVLPKGTNHFSNSVSNATRESHTARYQLPNDLHSENIDFSNFAHRSYQPMFGDNHTHAGFNSLTNPANNIPGKALGFMCANIQSPKIQVSSTIKSPSDSNFMARGIKCQEINKQPSGQQLANPTRQYDR